MTLRTRLVLITAALSALALLAANAAGIVLLRTYLTDRVDEQFAAAGDPADGVTAGRLASLANADRESRELLGDRFGGGSRIYVFGGDGALLAAVPAAEAPGGPRLPPAGELRARAGGPFTVPGHGGGASWRVDARTAEDGALVVTAFSLAQVDATVDRLLLIDAAVLGVVLLLLAAAAAWVIRLGLRPLTRIEATAGRITGGDLARRVRGAHPGTEPGRLGLAMNAMLDRVESEITARRASEQRLRRFLSDASHELRTPLTSIRGFAELARRGGDAGQALARIEAEATRMGVLVADLLLLARLDEQPRLGRAPVDLLALAADLAGAARVQAPERAISLTGHGLGGDRPEPVTVCGDALRLRQIVGNLLTNALRHTPPGAAVTLRVGRAGDAAVVEVADTGPGIPPEHVPRIFDRLYRVRAGAGADGGAGLGLPIAAALAQAHGGRVDVETAVGEGTTFRLTLPLAGQDGAGAPHTVRSAPPSTGTTAPVT
ncbi:HAMP domain-containing sensor histidine kinase [Streptomyces sp. MP131-18]|uniref:sensor histidine kinase n=1 Tax=Streptomyces sp. MP131-18 TaxID=1857892 RepID=UPI00097C3312|nr:HAMP domain-containing sensor histidine kinase [Streptomyces sp. MP131-18]ONK13463.1 putative sensor histidine kinase TcrY [Streptomyces sp. MP131-18]